MRIVWIGIAGSLGAVARYLVGGWVAVRGRGAFPWETLAVNASGSFLLGLVFVLLTDRMLPHPNLRTAVTVGFLGAYTTFSTFSLETLRLAEDGAKLLALANVGASVTACLLAVWIGTIVGRLL